MGVPQNGGFVMENPIKMDDLRVPLFQKTSIWMKNTFHLGFTNCRDWLEGCTRAPTVWPPGGPCLACVKARTGRNFPCFGPPEDSLLAIEYSNPQNNSAKC